MAAATPQSSSIARLLQGLNSGLSNFIQGGGRHAEAAAPTDDEKAVAANTIFEPVSAVTNFGNGVGDTRNLETPQQDDVVRPAALTRDTQDTMGGSKKAAVPSKKVPGPRKRKNNDGTKKKKNDCEPSIDPPRATMSNPLEMEDAFQEGYDSDGWIGPPRGTDEKELEDVEEDPITEKETTTQEPETAPIEPTHIPIPDDAFKKLTIVQLKHELSVWKVKATGLNKKQALQERLREALEHKLPVFSMEDLSKEKSKGKPKVDDMSAFALGAFWKELTPDIDVDEPTNEGFVSARAPTVPEEDANIQPRPKQSFSQKFDRAVFTGSTTTKTSYTKADGTPGFRTTTTIRNKGRPNAEFLHSHHLNKDSLPVEFVEAFFPMYTNKELDENGEPYLSMEYLAKNTNMRATLAFAGEATYDHQWSGPFSVKELRQYLGLYVINGLSPSPGLERKFDPKDNANYNAFVSRNLGGANGIRRLKQFKAFFSCQDPMKIRPRREDSPLFKVLSIVKWIRKVGPMSWECGLDLGLDEQTMGFQGMHVDKLRISYKKEGDGFQCDALCDDGFTYTVYFRNEKPPQRYIRMGLSPLHARSLWIFDQLKDKFHRVWVDNLYMSARFAKNAYNSKNQVLVAGVTRSKQRGVPLCVVQEPVEKKHLPTTRGTVKAAVLENDPKCPQLVSLSIYDNKPVHFISMIAESISWKENTRKVWNKHVRKMQEMKYLRVNVNDDYNHKMNPVDIADQLRNNYRMDRWLRNRKWWWSIYLWGQGVLITNAYIVYCHVMKEANVPKSQTLTHYDFLHSLATAWIDSDEEDIRSLRRIRQRKRKLEHQHASAKKKRIASTPQPTPQPIRKSSASANAAALTPDEVVSIPSKAPRVNDLTLHPTKGALRQRLDHLGCFHCPVLSKCRSPSCALHRCVLGREGGQTREKIVSCSICQVNLCIPCFRTFHTMEDTPSKKDFLKLSME